MVLHWSGGTRGIFEQRLWQQIRSTPSAWVRPQPHQLSSPKVHPPDVLGGPQDGAAQRRVLEGSGVQVVKDHLLGDALHLQAVE